jgi:hypothetical protein
VEHVINRSRLTDVEGKKSAQDALAAYCRQHGCDPVQMILDREWNRHGIRNYWFVSRVRQRKYHIVLARSGKVMSMDDYPLAH